MDLICLHPKGNPTRGCFERSMAAAENAKHCVAFSSGSAATSAVVHLLQHGDSILCIDDVYGGTQRYFRRIVNPSMNIQVDFLDFDDSEVVEKKMKSCEESGRPAKLFWLETPTNPTLKVRLYGKLSMYTWTILSKIGFVVHTIDFRYC
jgi:cystathionine gamma-lyase